MTSSEVPYSLARAEPDKQYSSYENPGQASLKPTLGPVFPRSHIRSLDIGYVVAGSIAVLLRHGHTAWIMHPVQYPHGPDFVSPPH